MLFLYDLCKVGRVCIYVDKSHYQTSRPSRVETNERCLPNLNVEYTGQCVNYTNLHVSSNLSEGGTSYIALRRVNKTPI